MDRFKQESELDESTKSETAAALTKSRQFLTQRLLPDLEAANTQHQSIVTQISEYKTLRDVLRSVDITDAQPKVPDADATMLTDIGAGVAIQTQL